MKFDVDLNGRTYAVSLEPTGEITASGGSFRVIVDAAAETIDVAMTDLGLSLAFEDGRTLDAAVTSRARGDWLVQLPHVTLAAVVDGRRRPSGPSGGVSAAGEQRVTAPMPGRIVRVLVKPGDEVAERQGLVVVEAMKMENELASPKAGRVKEVTVSEGLSVEAGRLLVVIE